MIEAILSNPGHPEYGVATIPFPIPREQYDHCVALLEALEIGDVSASDCYVDELQSKWPVLDRLLHTRINLDELDYLAKRLDSFDHEEFLQFHAMADKLELISMKDLINLTFCCQQATVIQDFCNLEAVGRSHYLNTHGGCADIEELKNLDGEETALLLIEGGEGTVTRYGVVYDNGMKLEALYDGKQFPAYHYEADSILVGLRSRQEPEDTANITWLCMPASRCQIERAARRSGTLDELYIWLSNLTTIEYIRNTLKRVRKKESALILASQNLEDFDVDGIRELTRPLFAIPTHQFLFNAGSVDKRFYMDNLQLEPSEYELIRYPQRGVCLYKCGNERYLLEVHAPPHKARLFGEAGGR